MSITEKLLNRERVSIKLDEDTWDKIKLLDLKVKSYDNLFMSYVNNTSENFNEFNMKKFLDLYFKVRYELDSTIEKIVKDFLIENEVRIPVNNQVDLNEGCIYLTGGVVCQLKKDI